MNAATVRERAGEFPDESGVYQFHEGETVLYVGKAVSLRDRVRSYADPRSDRIRRMVERADAVEFAVTETETQALLLEANLIKRNQPRYNVRLKDDKSYPLVQLTDHPAPRIEVTRDPDEAATAFGPFTSKRRVDVVVKALRETYGVRGCSEHKYEGRERPCLDHEMGLCTAPCTGEIDAENYREDVESVVRFFEGETGVLADPLRREMERAAQEQQFERAANLRDRLEIVESFHGGGGEAVADRAADGDRRTDVLGAAVEGDAATVARLHSERGQLVDRSRHRLDAPETADSEARSASGSRDAERPGDGETPQASQAAGANGSGDRAEQSSASSRNPKASGDVRQSEALTSQPETNVSGNVDETRSVSSAHQKSKVSGDGGDRAAAVIGAFVAQYYAERELPDELLLSARPDDGELRAWLDAEGVEVSVPGAGREAKLVELALKNARRGPERRDELSALADALSLSSVEAIEGFDVSHAQGKGVVGSDVRFVAGGGGDREAVAETAGYRRKKLPERNDDYANMRELIRWRAERAVEGRDDRADPDLLLIDGGEGQLAAARDALAETGWDVPAVALAKEEELVITPDGPRDWPSDAPRLHALQRVRDEAHRFAVQYHQTVRDDVSTALDGVPGVGPETRKRLLRRFGSVENVREASETDLRGVSGVGEKTAATLKSRL